MATTFGYMSWNIENYGSSKHFGKDSAAKRTTTASGATPAKKRRGATGVVTAAGTSSGPYASSTGKILQEFIASIIYTYDISILAIMELNGAENIVRMICEDLKTTLENYIPSSGAGAGLKRWSFALEKTPSLNIEAIRNIKLGRASRAPAFVTRNEYNAFFCES